MTMWSLLIVWRRRSYMKSCDFFHFCWVSLNPNPACETTVDTMDDKPKEVPQATIFLIV